MPNPVLDPKKFAAKAEEVQPGWAAPAGTIPAAPDEVSPWPPPPTAPVANVDPMTVGGVASATGVLITLLVVSAAFGWVATDVSAPDSAGNVSVSLPGFLIPALLVALGLAILTIFKPAWARVTAPLYAIGEGLVVGAISRMYDASYDGIVLQAIGLTIAVFLIMLGLFASGRIRVTEKLRIGIIASTGAVMLVYVVGLVAQLFGGEVSFINSPSAFGIIFSLVVVGIASANLLLDFDFVQRAVAARVPKQMEWYAAFGLVVTLVWLYLEILRLLAKLQRR
jgi:uncharacterized YccA/Bax inhibitor family protein